MSSLVHVLLLPSPLSCDVGSCRSCFVMAPLQVSVIAAVVVVVFFASV